MALRIFATLATFVCFAIGLYWFSTQLKTSDEMDQAVTISFGPATQDAVEMELPVTDLMVRHEPPGPTSEYRNAHEWSEAHLQVFDANGEKLTWRRIGHPTYTKGAAAGLSDGFLMFKLKPGATYKLRYTPSVAERISYSSEFEASTDSEVSERQLMLPRE
ncbi:MAG: hypothetical protein JXO22_10425 [Phycisphaerae bacterium]|nr:hypothetical protein [Phycisphaerae bacterium]